MSRNPSTPYIDGQVINITDLATPSAAVVPAEPVQVAPRPEANHVQHVHGRVIPGTGGPVQRSGRRLAAIRAGLALGAFVVLGASGYLLGVAHIGLALMGKLLGCAVVAALLLLVFGKALSAASKALTGGAGHCPGCPDH